MFLSGSQSDEATTASPGRDEPHGPNPWPAQLQLRPRDATAALWAGHGTAGNWAKAQQTVYTNAPRPTASPRWGSGRRLRDLTISSPGGSRGLLLHGPKRVLGLSGRNDGGQTKTPATGVSFTASARGHFTRCSPHSRLEPEETGVSSRTSPAPIANWCACRRSTRSLHARAGGGAGRAARGIRRCRDRSSRRSDAASSARCCVRQIDLRTAFRLRAPQPGDPGADPEFLQRGTSVRPCAAGCLAPMPLDASVHCCPWRLT